MVTLGTVGAAFSTALWINPVGITLHGESAGTHFTDHGAWSNIP